MAGAYWLHAPAGTAITGLTFAGTFDSFGGWVAHWATAGGRRRRPRRRLRTAANCISSTPTDMTWSVDDASEIGFGLWCDVEQLRGEREGRLDLRPRGNRNVYNATVYINDPSAPCPWLSRFTAQTDDPGVDQRQERAPNGVSGQPSPICDRTRPASAP